MTSGEALLDVRGLSEHFPLRRGLLARTVGLVKAVDGVSFALGQGRTLALVGESSCGKTTTARLLLRLLEPTEGTVTLDGQDVHAMKGADPRRFHTKVQAVFQDPWSSLNPRMRVRNIVAEPLLINQRLSRKEVDKRVDKVLEDVGLRPEHARNFPHEFSGGQRQRIAIAAALISEPKIPKRRRPCRTIEATVRKAGRSWVSTERLPASQQCAMAPQGRTRSPVA